MNLDRVVQVLRKVNALVENLDDQGQTSAIEKDLLKRYLRDLYEHVSETEPTGHRIAARESLVKPEENHVPATPEPEVKQEEKVEEAEPSSQEPAFSSEEQVTYYDAESEKVPAEAEVPEPTAEETERTPEPRKYFPPEPGEEELSRTSSPSAHQPQPEVAMDTMVDEGRFAPLFTEPDTTDLADKFKLQPIQSIESAMGINQRLQTINDLYDGDHTAFVETLKKLNGVSDFRSAKEILIKGPADRFSWDSDHKIKLARDFVDLVRRKYS